jgi:DNA-binding transcriptional MocR family regulator
MSAATVEAGTRRKAGAEGTRYEVVVGHITAMIEGGTLRVGERLPSVRRLAAQMGYAVGTVLHAYRRLEAGGRIEARPQSGYYVRSARPQLPEVPRSAPGQKAATPSLGRLMVRMSELLSAADVVPLGHAVPSAECLPTQQLNRYSAAIARRSRRGFNSYDVPPGCPELRQQVARHYVDAGCALSPEEIVTTCGCQEALGLCLRAAAPAGSVVAVSAPSYYGQLQTIELLGMKALEIPTDPRQGINLDALEGVLGRRKIGAVLLTTNCHNPLGFIMSAAEKQRLVRMLAKHDVPLIEDDIYGDLAFESPRPTVCKAYDREGRVLLCSSFSKTLAPGARVGWCAPGRYFEEIKRLKFCNTIATATLPQLAIAEYLAIGGYEHHLRKLRKRYADQVAQMAYALEEYFPAGTRATRPAGGHVLWVELPRGVDSVRLFEEAAALKISVAPGLLFSTTDAYRHCVRLNCSCTWDGRVERAVETIGRLAREQAEG